MAIRSFTFRINSSIDKNSPFATLEKFVNMCLFRRYAFDVAYEVVSSECRDAIVTVEGINDADADDFADYEDDRDDDDYDD